MSDNPTVVELRGVTFRRGERTILHEVDLTVRAGEHWALLGPNGAGKSTILGFVGASAHPTSGTVDILGQRLGRVELQALRRSIGHVNPRHPLHVPLTIRDIVLTGLTGSLETPPALGAHRAADAPSGKAHRTDGAGGQGCPPVADPVTRRTR